MSGIIVLVAIGLVVLFVVTVYNSLVRARNLVTNAFSQIDVQLKRRYDLIPNLIETAKGYMAHERETLEAVIKARNQAVTQEQKLSQSPADGEAMHAYLAAEKGFSGAMSKFLALAESYPDLKADTTMHRLMEELSTTENRISFARQAFNDAVMSYNNTRENFPQNIVAGSFGFQKAQSYEIEDVGHRENVKVSFK